MSVFKSAHSLFDEFQVEDAVINVLHSNKSSCSPRVSTEVNTKVNVIPAALCQKTVFVNSTDSKWTATGKLRMLLRMLNFNPFPANHKRLISYLVHTGYMPGAAAPGRKTSRNFQA